MVGPVLRPHSDADLSCGRFLEEVVGRACGRYVVGGDGRGGKGSQENEGVFFSGEMSQALMTWIHGVCSLTCSLTSCCALLSQSVGALGSICSSVGVLPQQWSLAFLQGLVVSM